MFQPAQRTAFGRKAVVDPPIDAAEIVSVAQPLRSMRAQQVWNGGQHGPEPVQQHGRARFLDKVFLWLPDAEAPGFRAIGLVLLRQALLPLVVMLVPIVVVAIVMVKLHMTSFNPGAAGYAIPSWWVASILPFGFGAMNLVQELNRYGFVRQAERPVRAVSIFSSVAIVVSLLLSHNSLIAVLGAIATQVIASAALIFALDYRKYIAGVLVALIAVHTAYDVKLLFVTHPNHSGPIAHKPGSIEPVPASLQSWARLYPGAVPDRANTMTMLGIVNWSARYTIKASPDQIGAFYQDLATRQGFTQTRVILGQHQYSIPGKSSGFRYSVFPTEQGSMVDFLAQGDAPAK